MSIFVPGLPTDATAIELLGETVPLEQRLSGNPTTGILELGEFGDAEIGVWEMSPGSMRDVEADEVFLVLSGAATVHFEDDGRSIRLAPGDIVRLSAGMRTVWTVTETLRKLYLA